MSRALLHNAQLPGEAFELPGSGEDAVLLFHGFTATPNEVLGLGTALQRAGYSTYGPMLPGHGAHPRDLDRARWQDWAAAAETAYDRLAARHRRVIVGGESLGGMVALYLAAARPQAAAVLAYAPAFMIPLKPYERLILRLLTPLGVQLPKGGLRGNTTWQGYRVNPLRALAQVFLFQAVVQESLPRVCQPALIAQGRRDATVDPRGAQEVYQRIGSPVKSLRWFDDAPHCLLIAHEREEVYAATLDFLKSHAV